MLLVTKIVICAAVIVVVTLAITLPIVLTRNSDTCALGNLTDIEYTLNEGSINITWTIPEDSDDCDLEYFLEITNENGLYSNETVTTESYILEDIVSCVAYTITVTAAASDLTTNIISLDVTIVPDEGCGDDGSGEGETEFDVAANSYLLDEVPEVSETKNDFGILPDDRNLYVIV